MKKTPAKNTKTVLIVDDEELFLASLQEGLLLFADEFSVVTALNGRDALEKLSEFDIDLVVTDLKMPEMDGFELLARMLKSYSYLPVIVMTAFGTPEIEKHIHQMEIFDYLEKPIDLHMLAEKIRFGLNKTSDGHLKGIMLFSFLQLLQVEKKTCILKLKSAGKKGILCFSKGELVDAAYRKLTGESAAFEIVCWDEVEIEIVQVLKELPQRIKKPLPNILMEAAQKKDEALIGNTPAEEFWDEKKVPDLFGDRSEFTQRQSELTNEEQKFSVMFTESDGQNSFENDVLEINNTKEENIIKMANNINQSLEELMAVDGATAVALVDSESGMALGAVGSGVNLEVAAAGNTEVVRAKQKVMNSLGLKDKIEDILISLGTQYHLIRPLTNHQNLFFYLVLNRAQSNLAMARFKLSDIEARVEV